MWRIYELVSFGSRTRTTATNGTLRFRRAVRRHVLQGREYHVRRLAIQCRWVGGKRSLFGNRRGRKAQVRPTPFLGLNGGGGLSRNLTPLVVKANPPESGFLPFALLAGGAQSLADTALPL